jgi:FKBP-type peptidyl-prolyl cis-trans isomerase
LKLKTLFAVACSALPAGTDTVTAAGGLKYADITVGTGSTAAAGSAVSVHYTGWLANGTGFDTSIGFSPISFTLGAHQVVAGFEQGIVGMKVGGKRRLIIPPALGYGASEVKDEAGKVVIPANSTLIFDISLVAVAN